MPKLLASNHKLDLPPDCLGKGKGKGYLVTGLSLMPGGWRCPFSEHCLKDCIGTTSGLNVTKTARDAKRMRTQWLEKDPEGFFKQLHKEIGAHVRKADKLGLIPAVRLNVYSDIPWETILGMRVRVPLAKGYDPDSIFKRWSMVQFYDYTKDHRRLNGELPKNYYLNFSFDGHDYVRAAKAYAMGFNPVVVASDVKKGEEFPKRWCHMPVIDGDKHDLRFLDGKGVVMLRAKGSLKKEGSKGIAVQIKDRNTKDNMLTARRWVKTEDV